MADALPQLVWTARPDGSCNWLSRQWVEYTGVPLRQQLGDKWFHALHPEDQHRAQQAWRDAAEERGEYDLEYRIRRHDGQYRWFYTRGRALRDTHGKVTRWLGTCTDIHDRRMIREELLAAKEQAEHANQSKDRFLAVLSHELRTPLTPVMMVLSALEADPRLHADLRDDLRMIRRNIELETKLIDDLLDVTRIVRGKLRLQPAIANVHELLHHVVETLRHTPEARSMHLACDLQADNPTVVADPARLQQVFWNLVQNAIKFTAADGRIAIRTRTLAEPALTPVARPPEPPRPWIEITVRDQGVGISPQGLHRIFSAFEQVHDPGGLSEGRQFGGLGLGLAIAKALVDLHGGTLRADSDGIGKGACFTVELPTARITPPTPSSQDVTAAAQSSQGLQILLVEDHPDTLAILARLLRRLGHQVRTASRVADALELFRQEPPEILISDIGLPDGSGHQLALEARKLKRDLIAVAVSGYGMDADLRQSHASGFSTHLIKPVDPMQLDQLIRRLYRECHSPASPPV